MQYLSELPEISSIGRDGNLVELELEQDISGEMPDPSDAPVVLVATYAGDIFVVVGEVVDFKRIEGPEVWCRLKMKGRTVQVSV